jgi:regulator of replication initiation timing
MGFIVEMSKARELHDELLQAKPADARHDADICSFCVDKAAQSTAPVPSGPENETTEPEGTEGGTTKAMADNENKMISEETHQALMEKALKDATSATDSALQSKVSENTELASKVETLTEENASLVTDNARLNKELDEAQVSLKAATDEVASLKTEKEEIEAAAALAETASKRGEQIRNLKLFPEEFVTERASRWAAIPDEDWAERVAEWQATAKPAAGAAAATTDSASALEGTSGDLTTETAAADDKATSARRAALGLQQ